LLLALVLLNTSWLAVGAVAIFLAAPFVLDALRHAGTAIRQVAKLQPFLRAAGSAFGNLAVVARIALLGRLATSWIVGVAAGARLFVVTATIVAGETFTERDADTSVIADIGLDRPERLAETGARLEAGERERIPADRGWIAALVLVLFAIHV